MKQCREQILDARSSGTSGLFQAGPTESQPRRAPAAVGQGAEYGVEDIVQVFGEVVRQEEAAVVRRKVEARVQSPDILLVEEPNAEFLEACGLPYLQAQPLQQKLPKYTREAAAKKVQGSVLLEGVIEQDGRVRESTVLKSLEHSLDNRSLEVVSKDWRFRPATIGGRPVRQRARMEINYRLK